MHLRHVLPFLALFAWQVTPPDDPRDRSPRNRVWLGLGTRTFDYAYWGTAGGECLSYDDASCACTSRSPIRERRYDDKDKVTSVGMQLDVWPVPTARVSVAGGSAGSGQPLFAAGLVAWEARLAGLGAGWAQAADGVDYQGVAGYLRLGPLDGAHLRAEVRNPTSMPEVSGWARVGLAISPGERSGSAAIFFGLSSVVGGPDTTYASHPGSAVARVTRTAFFADLLIPVNRDLEVFVRGHVATKARGFGLGVALRP